jgi:hypothetical protein
MPQNDHTDDRGASSDTTTSDTAAVPVFCHVPEAAAERAMRRFQQYREADLEDLTVPDQGGPLRDFVLDEIHQKSVTYVGGQPLEQWVDEHADDITPDEG